MANSRPRSRSSSDPQNPSLSLCDAQKQARNCGLDIPKLQGQKNLNADFNKNLGSHLKDYLELDERVGITSLRRILFKKGYCVINDILTSRYVENSELERSASDKISTESEH